MPPHVPVPTQEISKEIADAEAKKQAFIKRAVAKQFSREQAEFLYEIFGDLTPKSESYFRRLY
jgi:hypothetical protein